MRLFRKASALIRPKSQEIRMVIGRPHNREFYNTQFVDSYLAFDLELGADIRIAHARCDVAYVEDMRNTLVSAAQDLKATHLLQLDTDMAFPEDTIRKMVTHALQGQQIVGALYFSRLPPYRAHAYHINDKRLFVQFEANEFLGKSELMEVNGIGAGCLLTDMRVFDTIPKPWFSKIQRVDKPEEHYGDDISFCLRAIDAKIPIYVDPTLRPVHIVAAGISGQGQIICNGDSWVHYGTIEAMQKEINAPSIRY